MNGDQGYRVDIGASGIGSPKLASYSFPNQPGQYGIPDGGITTYGLPVLHSEVTVTPAILLGADYRSGKITKDQSYRAIGNNINNPAPNIHMLWNVQSAHTPGPTEANVNNAAKAARAVDFAVTGAHQLDKW